MSLAVSDLLALAFLPAKSPVAAVHLSCLTSEVKRNQCRVMCTQERRIRLIFNFAMLVLLQF